MTISVSIALLTIPPTIGAAIRFMTLAPVPALQRIGSKPGDDGNDGHHLGSDPLHRAFPPRPRHLGRSGVLTRSGAKVPGLVQVDEHHYPRFRRDPGQRDEPNGYRDRPVVVESPQNQMPPTSAKGSDSRTMRVSGTLRKLR